MWRRSRVSSLLLSAVLVVLVGWAWSRFGLSRVTAVVTLLSLLFGLLAAIRTGPLRWPVGGKESSPEQIDQAARKLAVEIRKQWDEEARRRRLVDATEMPVRWVMEDRPADDEGLAPEGQLPRLIDVFASQPRPMVVIGGPGSGKTGLCVILTLDLLDDPSPSRVPVVLQLSAWNPAENLDEWLVRRLLEDYPFLGNEPVLGGTAARELVAQRRIMPILDGLDEMPAGLRPAALEAIEADWSSSRPFVLTCRTDEFRQATRQDVLAGVLVVRLLPLIPDAAAGYLLDAAPDAALDSWEPVLADMVERPEGPVARTLTRPLMLYLARTAFGAPGSRPDDLLDSRRFGTEDALETYLLDRFIPRVYGARPARQPFSPTRPSVQWDVELAERTLVFLAAFLRSLSTRDLAWWQLHRVVPRPVAVVVRLGLGALGCGLLGWLMFGLFGRPWLGIAFGVAVGLLGATPLGRVREKVPRRFVPRLLRRSELAPEFLIRDVVFGLVGALVGGLIVGLLFSVGYGVLIGVFFGFVFGLVRRFTEPTEPKEPTSPAGVLAGDRSTVLYALLLGGTAGAIAGGFLASVMEATEYGLIYDLDPIRETALGAGVGALLGACGLGMMVYATSAWAQFIIARLWLASRRRAPLRLATFLEDAHKLGVLRQLGSTYQFRHALLQDRLLERTPDGPAPVEGRSERLTEA